MSSLIPFEAHLTMQDIAPAQLPAMEAFCKAQGHKPLLIELSRGQHFWQPMASFIAEFPHLEAAMAAAKSEVASYSEAGFPIGRVKIETPATMSDNVSPTKGFTPYFEWHGRILLHDSPALLALCALHQAHLSCNALHGDPDRRFVTLREFGDRLAFEGRKETLIAALTAQGWPLQKQQSEYCVYDSHVALDHGWLTPLPN